MNYRTTVNERALRGANWLVFATLMNELTRV